MRSFQVLMRTDGCVMLHGIPFLRSSAKSDHVPVRSFSCARLLMSSSSLYSRAFQDGHDNLACSHATGAAGVGCC